MQTFLPYADFNQSAACLDRQRLGKQRVETKQIYLALTNPSYGWQNHPAVKMWRGCEVALGWYGQAVCREWIKRGYKDTMLPFFDSIATASIEQLPTWFGDTAFHFSHLSNLIRKLPAHYAQLWPDISAELPYVWPV